VTEHVFALTDPTPYLAPPMRDVSACRKGIQLVQVLLDLRGE
jgi:hypothetical protein